MGRQVGTRDLANVVGPFLGAGGRVRPAVFSGTRIVVDGELGHSMGALRRAETLKLGGRLVVISYHSLRTPRQTRS